MGRRIWVVVEIERLQPFSYDTRVLSFKAFLPADPPKRKKHLVQLWTETGLRTLSVGSIRLKDPRRVAAQS